MTIHIFIKKQKYLRLIFPIILLFGYGCEKSEPEHIFKVSTLTKVPSGAAGHATGLNYPTGLTIVDKFIYVTDSYDHVIYRVTIETGSVSLFAGTPGVSGYSNGNVLSSLFYRPFGIANDGKNLYVADSGNEVIRRIVLATGEVSNFVGNPGVSGSLNGKVGLALLNHPQGVTTDGVNLYIADTTGAIIRKVDMITRYVKTIAGLAGVAGPEDGKGNAGRFNTPRGIATDGKNLYVADSINGAIRKIEMETGDVTTLAGVPFHPGSTDGKGSWAAFNNPSAISIDGNYLYVADTANSTIRKILISKGQVNTIAGNAIENGFKDGNGTESLFANPSGIAIDKKKIYVADTANHVIRVLE